MFDLFQLVTTGNYVPGMRPVLGEEDSPLVAAALFIRSLFTA